MNSEFLIKATDLFSQVNGAQMQEIPQRGSNHRRAHSDNYFGLSDEFLFDVSDLDLSVIGNPNSLQVPMTVDSCRSDESSSDNKSSGTVTNRRPPPPVNHLRSLSMDADFFEGLSLTGEGGRSPAIPVPAGMHRRNNSMDGSSSSFEGDSFMDGTKKPMAPEKLAELALIDPKRAKRILANRQSAARSKERKIRYAGELERKVQTLQTEATTLSTQVTMLQKDTTGLSVENRELKLRLEAMEQQAQLKDALNEALKDEIQRLRLTTGQIQPANIDAPNSNSFARYQPVQSSNGQNSVNQLQSSFMGFDRRV